MKPADQIRRLIDESQITSGPGADRRILGDALDQLATRRRGEPALWRSIMTNRKTRLAAAAVIVFAALIVFHFIGNPVAPTLTFAQVVEPILKASTAEFDIVIGGDGENKPVVHDLVMGSRIRRTISGMDNVVTIIDLETGRMLVLVQENKEAQYMSLEGLPSMPNYMDHLKNLILTLQNAPDFVIEDLDEREIDGRAVIGFLAKHPRAEVTIWADAETGLPVRIDQSEGQMQTICKNMEFDVPVEEAWFSMEVPEGYTLQEDATLDLEAGTEEAFIEGLRLLAGTFNEGQFPAGVAVEDYLKQAAQVARQIDEMDLSAEEEMAMGQTINAFLLFTRFFRGEGEWTYQGQGVMLGDAETPIFWYRPRDSETYRVIYGDLHVEDVAPEDLPEPLPPRTITEPGAGYQSWSRPEFVGRQENFYTVLPDAQVRVEAHLTLLKGPHDTSLMPIRLPNANAPLESVRLGEPGALAQDLVTLPFHAIGDSTYNVELPLEELLAGRTMVICQWHAPLDAFRFERGKYWVDIEGLIPTISHKVNVGVDPDSGFELTLPVTDGWANPFTSAVAEEPINKLGRCALAIQKRQ